MINGDQKVIDWSYVMIGIPAGLLYANAIEWVTHKYVLHNLGKKKDSLFAFHWHEHHRASRKHGFHDEKYERSVFGLHSQGKEALGLVALTVAHLPLVPIAPFFTGTLLYSAFRYFHVHRKAHLDPEWAKENVPWHYDHHMGPDQNANWCVTKHWFDHLMGTRKPFLPEREQVGDEVRADTNLGS